MALPATEVIVINVIAAFAGGAFGAALGALPAFIFTGFMVIAGESANLVSRAIGDAGAADVAILGSITGSIGFGAVFGPHISFAGGAAAAAYAAKKGYMDTGFDYHEAKNITHALGTRPDVLAVGGAFGILGYFITLTSGTLLAAPWDPIAMGVVLSAFAHRLAFGYDIIGDARKGLMNMKPFEAEERRVMGEAATNGGETATDGGETARFLVEPWLPHQYKWPNVTMIGFVVGILGGFIALTTGSPFLAFGISAATLLFLNLGVANIPVTHHMSLPASTAALAVVGGSAPESLAAAGVAPLLVGGVFGIVGALAGEVVQRIFYAHADTHLDPPAFAIVIATFIIALLTFAGVFSTAVWIPMPF
ncbi:hypothetical protein SAMN04487948_105348 [Halogranum amylolyticum]|uniref:DUF7973 domain-containing protein n=1 Tax=Halogranum amylolyticum TaxID=660520 RepID=A0A1H8SVK7_9EURY|nr:hypothetical protein [Halogranum amylolyticum]SEO82565.1 hypothetical protein SAMN04487948_105348 [Halogranum amylolyticum]